MHPKKLTSRFAGLEKIWAGSARAGRAQPGWLSVIFNHSCAIWAFPGWAIFTTQRYFSPGSKSGGYFFSVHPYFEIRLPPQNGAACRAVWSGMGRSRQATCTARTAFRKTACHGQLFAHAGHIIIDDHKVVRRLSPAIKFERQVR